MARYHLVNTDGHRNAAIGDRIVTGGGIYKVTAYGGVRVDSLPTATGTSRSASEVASITNSSRLASGNSRGLSGTGVNPNARSASQATSPTAAKLPINSSFNPENFMSRSNVNAEMAGNVAGVAVLAVFGFIVFSIVLGGIR